MVYQFVRIDNDADALPRYFKVLLNRLKVGFVMCITGGTGAKIGCGKSYTALKMAEQIDKTFSVDKVAFTPVEFLKALDAVEKSGRPGQVVVLDEGEITAPSNEWFKVTNKAIGYTMATFRYLRCCVIIVTPSFSWIDKKLRTLVSYWGYPVLSIGDDGENQVNLYLYRVKTDLFGEQMFFEKLRFYDARVDKKLTGKRYRVSLPSAELIEAYEKKSQRFKRDLRQQLLHEAEAFEKAVLLGDNKNVNFEALAEKALKDRFVLEQLAKRGRVSASKVLGALRGEITPTYASAVAELVSRKWALKSLQEQMETSAMQATATVA